MKLNSFLSVPIACLLLTGLAHAQPVTLANPNFDTPALNGVLGGTQTFVGTGTPSYLSGSAGWYVSGSTNDTGSVTLANPGLLGLLSPITGSNGQYLVLNGGAVSLGFLTPGAQGGISQVIATTPGRQYTVNYATAALSLGVITANTAQLYAGVEGVTVTSPSGGALLNLSVGGFSNQSFNFTAIGNTSVLDFYENGALAANVGGIALDSVTVTAVPEPHETAGMFIAFVIGLAWVRKLTRKSAEPGVALV